MDGLNSFSSSQLPDSLIKLHFSICPLCDGQDFLKSCEFLRPRLTVLFRAKHEQRCCSSQIDISVGSRKSIIRVLWKIEECVIDDFSWVCVAASLIEVYLCWGNEQEGRGRTLYPSAPSCTPQYLGPCTPWASGVPRNTWAPVPPWCNPQYHLWPSKVPPVTLSTHFHCCS